MMSEFDEFMLTERQLAESRAIYQQKQKRKWRIFLAIALIVALLLF